jgi:hypothetical protein
MSSVGIIVLWLAQIIDIKKDRPVKLYNKALKLMF